MLDDRDFETLDGCPTVAQLELLPVWARTYERELRKLAAWWSIRSTRHRPKCPIVNTPKHGELTFRERLQHLPLWAQDWLATLRFEVYWQQQQVAPLVTGPSRLKLFALRARVRRSQQVGRRCARQAH